jgi:hypothetical protein
LDKMVAAKSTALKYVRWGGGGYSVAVCRGDSVQLAPE